MLYNVDRTAVVGRWLFCIIVAVTVFMTVFFFYSVLFLFNLFFLFDICDVTVYVCLILCSPFEYAFYFSRRIQIVFRFVHFFFNSKFYFKIVLAFSPFNRTILVCVALFPLNLSNGWSGMQRKYFCTVIVSFWFSRTNIPNTFRNVIFFLRLH